MVTLIVLGSLAIVLLLLFSDGAGAPLTDEDAAKEFSRITPLGMIVSSLLTPLQFRSLAGPAWVPADGRPIDGHSPYALLTGYDRVPDLRGMFLRGLNEFKLGETREDGRQDPEPGRHPGSYQGDAYAKHHHAMALHHDQPWGRYGGSAPAIVGTTSANFPLQNSSNEGGGETRPKNVAVYYYIKIM